MVRVPLHRPGLAWFEPPALDEGQSTYAFLPAHPDVGQKVKASGGA